MFGLRRINDLPQATKVILLTNIILFVATLIVPQLEQYCALYSFSSDQFQPYRFITHMFMHAGFWHLFFNMFSLYMFGAILEEVWGSKRFVIFYFATGFGAAALHLLVKQIEINTAMAGLPPEMVDTVLQKGYNVLMQGKNYIDVNLAHLNILVNTPTVGASGAIYGLLLAFGMMFPNAILYIYAAIPIKAKYLVLIFIATELLLGFLNSGGDNVAHFAHLGGMLVGLIFILIWRKKGFNKFDI